MVYWKSLHESSDTNAEIAASASQIFFTSDYDKQQLVKNQQSFNALEINNDDNTTPIDVYLDGLSSRKRRVFAKSSLVIAPEEGIYFNNVKVENTSGALAIAAGKIQLNARVLKPVRER